MRLPSDVRSSGYLRAALVAPFGRLEEAPVWSWITGTATAAVQLLTDVPLLGLLLILMFVSLLDFLLGSEIARRNGTYDPNLARGGMIGKATGVLLVLIVWSVEALIDAAGLIDTHAALATALAVVLLAVEIESFDQHRETLTGRPTPLIRPIIDFLRGFAEGAIPRAGSAGKKGG
jgi:hypothetical protein